jgi:methylenetetrahydrofolate dehydrogenase (NADP+) / methenyltetrahydrofolate cyclohydrolase
MTHTVIDGRKIAESRKDELVEDCRRLRADGIACGLATVLVGDRYSSHAYERRLARLAAEPAQDGPGQ